MPNGANKISQLKPAYTAPFQMVWKSSCYQTKEKKIMISKFKLMVIAAVTALSIGVPTAAMAQSAWTTGTASNKAAAGYETPFNYPR
jgi:hypothetical protein